MAAFMDFKRAFESIDMKNINKYIRKRPEGFSDVALNLFKQYHQERNRQHKLKAQYQKRQTTTVFRKDQNSQFS